MTQHSKAEIIRLRNYILVGSSAFALEYGVFFILDSLIDTYLLVAQSISFILGLLISFLGSRYITFSSKDGKHIHNATTQMASFLALGMFNLVASNASMYVLVTLLGIYSLGAKIIVMGCIVVWNYLIFNKFIFKRS